VCLRKNAEFSGSKGGTPKSHTEESPLGRYKVIGMYDKQSSAVNCVIHRSSTYRGEDLPPPRFVRLCSPRKCGAHLPWTDWADVLSVLDEHLCILRLADTLYIMPALADPQWGSA
jgi:hypothetical protein